MYNNIDFVNKNIEFIASSNDEIIKEEFVKGFPKRKELYSKELKKLETTFKNKKEKIKECKFLNEFLSADVSMDNFKSQDSKNILKKKKNSNIFKIKKNFSHFKNDMSNLKNQIKLLIECLKIATDLIKIKKNLKRDYEIVIDIISKDLKESSSMVIEMSTEMVDIMSYIQKNSKDIDNYLDMELKSDNSRKGEEINVTNIKNLNEDNKTSSKKSQNKLNRKNSNLSIKLKLGKGISIKGSKNNSQKDSKKSSLSKFNEKFKLKKMTRKNSAMDLKEYQKIYKENSDSEIMNNISGNSRRGERLSSGDLKNLKNNLDLHDSIKKK